MRHFLSRVAAFLRPGHAERELSRQVAADLKIYEDAFRQRGLSQEDAARQARLAFGGVVQVMEHHREARAFPWLDDLHQDLRYASRSFLRSPGFTLVAVLTLALGIGANATIFSVVNAVMLRPLPYPHPEQLIYIIEHQPAETRVDGKPGRSYTLDSQDYLEWQNHSTLLEQVAAYDARMPMTLSGGDEPLRLTGAAVTPSLFPLLGFQPAFGPGFGENGTSAEPRVILSRRTWRGVFGSDPNILSRSITLDGSPYRVVGVMPDDFAFPNRATAFWIPLMPRAVPNEITVYNAIARMKDGVSLERAQAEASSLLKGFRGYLWPDAPLDGKPQFEVVRIHDDLVAPVRQALLVLLVGVGFVLLITCTNVANLMLARHSARQGEVAIRVALGAGRARLVRQLITESVLLGLLGGLGGVAIAVAGVRALSNFGPADLPRLNEIDLDGRVLAFTLVLSVIAGVLVGLLPAARMSRDGPIEALKIDAGGRSSRHSSGRSVLVVAEVAMATVLLVGGGLLIRSFWNLSGVDPGFNTNNLLIFQAALPRGAAVRFAAGEKSDTFRTSVQSLPGVTSVAFSNALPLRRRDGTSPRIQGAPPSLRGQPNARIVSSNYVATIGLRVMQGRTFGDEAAAGLPTVVLVNETLARHYGAEGALGKTLTIAGRPAEIIGVVGDTREFGMDQEPNPLVYIDARQISLRMLRDTQALSWAFFAVRGAGDPAALVPDIRRVLNEVVPNAALELDVDSMAGIISTSVAQRRFYAIVVGIFAALAVALAAIGVYGVMAYAVTQRTREIGIRMALGAAGQDVLRLVLGQSLPLTAIGVLLGLSGAVAVTRFLEGMLFGLTPLDPSTFAGVAALLAVIATVAALIPARRATRVDPLVALRYE